MVKRCIGIDIGPSHLHAVQIYRRDEQFHIEKVHSIQIRRSTDSLQDIIRTLISRHGFDRRFGIVQSVRRQRTNQHRRNRAQPG